jgi:hypothetical protein
VILLITYEVINSRLSEVKLLDEDQIIKKIEEIINQFELNITQKSPLSTLKGSTHYHLKIGKQAGLLEVTYWPIKKRLWVEIHDNRASEWNQAMIRPFSDALAECFSGILLHEINNLSG